MTRRPSPWRVARRFPGTLAIAALTLGMFGLEHLLGGGTDLRAQMRLGALRTDRLVEHWELWRLVMPMFLHHGAIHLALNGLALLQLGPLVESLWGTRRLLVFYVCSGIAASLVSAAFNAEGVAAALGASGALMGLAGLLLGASLFGEESARTFLVQLLGQRLLRAVLLTLAIGVGLWFVLPIIDNWAHVGGLVTGLALAVAYPDPADREDGPASLAAMVAAGIVVAAFAASAFGGRAAMATVEIDTARQLSIRSSRSPGGFASVQALTQMLEWYDEAEAPAEGLDRFERAVAKFQEPVLLQILAGVLFEQVDAGRDRDAHLERVLARWVELSPEQPEALNALAWHLVTRTDDARRDPQRAEVLSRESLARIRAPGAAGPGCGGGAQTEKLMRAQFLDTLGEILYQQDRLEEALEVQSESAAIARELELDAEDLEEITARLQKIEDARSAG
jgi:membrane associated rhomboid family serine protease